MAGDRRIRRSNPSRVTRKTCIVCGKVFYSAGDGDVCVKPSTCRVKLHQLRAKANELAQRRIADFDYYSSYQKVTAQRPTLIEPLDEFLLLYDVAAAKANVKMIERMLAGEI